MNKYLINITLVLLFVSLNIKVNGQGSISNKAISKEYKEYTDSLKRTPYEWHLPVMGAKLRSMGFDLPNPNGIMVNYAYSKQQLLVSDLNVGFSEDNLVNVDGLARFNSIVADVNAVMVRYDFWLLPFLNLYGVAGKINSKTNVSLGLPFQADFIANSSGTSVGWGTVLAGGYGPLVLSGDFTQAWTFVSSLDKPTTAIVANVRIGHMFRFKKRPHSNLVVLVGGGYLGINKNSSGNLDLEKVIGITPEEKQRISGELNGWYNGLPESEQEVFGGIYDGLSGWLSDEEHLNLYYDFNKEMYYPWSLSLGANYQINKRYQVTAMYSFLGSREQFVLGLSYRFGFRGKNYLHGVTL